MEDLKDNNVTSLPDLHFIKYEQDIKPTRIKSEIKQEENENCLTPQSIFDYPKQAFSPNCNDIFIVTTFIN